jgi:hypothetical protein
MQYASERDLKGHVPSSESTLRHSLVYGRSRLKHAVSEESMILTEDKRPEPNQLIELRPDASQRNT